LHNHLHLSLSDPRQSVESGSSTVGNAATPGIGDGQLSGIPTRGQSETLRRPLIGLPHAFCFHLTTGITTPLRTLNEGFFFPCAPHSRVVA
jgi:hypothetical protein